MPRSHPDPALLRLAVAAVRHTASLRGDDDEALLAADEEFREAGIAYADSLTEADRRRLAGVVVVPSPRVMVYAVIAAVKEWRAADAELSAAPTNLERRRRRDAAEAKLRAAYDALAQR